LVLQRSIDPIQFDDRKLRAKQLLRAEAVATKLQPTEKLYAL